MKKTQVIDTCNYYIVNSDYFQSLNSLSIPIPVRTTTIPDLWDQYLLYGLQPSKRSRDEVISSSLNPEEKLSYLSLCLTKEELLNNHYMVIENDSTLH